MLEPTTRRLLLEALRPPAGATLDLAVASTFTLNLHALLTAPLAFAMFDWEMEDEHPEANVIASLEAVRRHAERIHIFCQAGEIAAPPDYRTLVGYLEGSVHEVAVPSGSIFHPKVWALRFRRTADGSPSYRLLCLSRNLTFDRSWDTVLSLEGEASHNDRPKNADLQTFITTLPQMAVHPLDQNAIAEIEQLALEISSVEFKIPEGFDRLTFHAMGPSFSKSAPMLRYPLEKLLVISPFLTATAMRQIGGKSKDSMLVSRPESIDGLGETALADFKQTYVLSGDAVATSLHVTEETEENGHASPTILETELSGLHAKVFIGDRGERAHVWIGSANATDAGFHANVEFLVELSGPIETCGVETVIGERDREIGLLSLLLPYQPGSEPLPPEEDEEALEQLDELARAIASRPFEARASITTDGIYDLVLSSRERIPTIPTTITATCWPITVKPGIAKRPLSDASLTFVGLDVDRLTPFFAIELEQRAWRVRKRFVVNASLIGGPTDRKDRILASLIRNADDFLLYLRFLLADLSDAQGLLEGLGGESSNDWGFGGSRSNGALLEPLMRALARNPGRLDDVARLVDDLARTPYGLTRIPSEFAQVWDALWAVREGLRK